MNPNPPVLDTAVFADLQATAGADFARELVGTFADEAPAMLVELRAALAAGAAERHRRAAHSLKSNAVTFGALALAERARAVELGGLPDAAAGAAAIGALEAELARALAALREAAGG